MESRDMEQGSKDTGGGRRRLLMVGPLFEEAEAPLRQLHECVRLWEQPDRATFLREQRGRFDAGVTMARHGCDADVFACLAGTMLSSLGAGFDKIDLDAAREYRVQVSNTPGVLDAHVADTAFGLVIAAARELPAADRYTQAGRWPQAVYRATAAVSGKRMGIVGLGGIGTVIARRAAGFDMEVRYNGPRRKADSPLRYEPDLHALASWCDFLVLSCPGGPQTHRLVSASVLQALGPRGYLINIARGSVIDEHAFIDALDRGVIAGAGLDVYWNEPHVPAALLGRDNVVLLPHVAASTHEARLAVCELTIGNLRAYFETGRPVTPLA
jgi:lactate dehydrogenase-like 2-hydroxyacid dehydrogenase